MSLDEHVTISLERYQQMLTELVSSRERSTKASKRIERLEDAIAAPFEAENPPPKAGASFDDDLDDDGYTPRDRWRKRRELAIEAFLVERGGKP